MPILSATCICERSKKKRKDLSQIVCVGSPRKNTEKKTSKSKKVAKEKGLFIKNYGKKKKKKKKISVAIINIWQEE